MPIVMEVGSARGRGRASPTSGTPRPLRSRSWSAHVDGRAGGRGARHPARRARGRAPAASATSRPTSHARLSCESAVRQASSDSPVTCGAGRRRPETDEAAVRLDPDDDVLDGVDRVEGDRVGARQRRSPRRATRPTRILIGFASPARSLRNAGTSRSTPSSSGSTTGMPSCASRRRAPAQRLRRHPLRRSKPAPSVRAPSSRISSISSPTGGMRSPSSSNPSK